MLIAFQSYYINVYTNDIIIIVPVPVNDDNTGTSCTLKWLRFSFVIDEIFTEKIIEFNEKTYRNNLNIIYDWPFS